MSNFMHKTIFGPALGLALATLSTLACDTGDDASPEPRAASIDPTPQVDGPAQPEAAPPVYGSLAEQLAAMQPKNTRAGWLRFSDPAINQPEAAPHLLARLVAGQDPPQVRAALAEAIGRTGADYAAEVSALLANEADARVREMLVGTLGRSADTAAAQPGLLLGLQDPSADVRAATLRSIARRSDGAALGDATIALLADADAKVRSEAATTLGVLGVEAALEPLTPLLADADPDVRLQALRALDRIQPIQPSSLSLATLEQDEDPRIQRLASSIHTR